MKRNLMFAAIAAAATITALPATAQDWRRGDDDYRRGRPQHITVHTEDGDSFRTYPGERMHRILSSNPFKFKPGRIYDYRDCRRGRCEVLVTDPYGRQRHARIVAPSIERYFGRG